MANKIFTTQNWRIICNTQENQTSGNPIQIIAKAPKDGDESTFTAVLDDDPDRIYYDVAVGEMAVAGEWTVWPVSTIAGKLALGTSVKVLIYAPGT